MFSRANVYQEFNVLNIQIKKRLAYKNKQFYLKNYISIY
jgi:hypothetical protein